jgi:cell division protein FtsW (lipid II flippase)
VVVGIALFALGGYLVAGHIGHISDRIDAWQDPFNPILLNKASGGSYQLAQGLWAQADGGVLGQGFGQAVLRIGGQCATPATSTVNCSLLPAPHTDFIYAVIVNELGLAGAAGLLCVYLLLVQRGFKIAMLARDSFSKLLATGLTSVFALQVFVIVGGVTKLIPLTGVTLPFVSYGGSSVLANFVLLALLLLVSDRARRDAATAP